MKLAREIEKLDQDYILDNLKEEFLKLSNSTVLITGGAGFLGFYFVKSILYWNDNNPDNTISLIIYDSFIRGTPIWLQKMSQREDIIVNKHDITKKLPADIEEVN